MIIQTPDELVDIVNEQDEVIATAWRSQSKGRRYMRGVLAIIINSENKFCLFRKRGENTRWPFHVGLVGGGVQSGESYDEGVRREVLEEINLDMHTYSWRQLGLIAPHHIEYNEEHKNHYANNFFKMIYEIRIDHAEIPYNPQDFDAYWWLSANEIYHGNPLGKFFPDLPWLIKHFYPHLLVERNG